jgi:flagella basal body P-ring formation protein FlgA
MDSITLPRKKTLAKRFQSLFYCLIPLVFSDAQAQELQSLPAIQHAVEAFVKEKTVGLPGEYTVTATRVDSRLKLSKCSQLQPYLPSGSRLWGNSSVGVRCAGPESWSLYVPVQIKVANQVLVAVRPITSGQQVQPGDVELQLRDITRFAGSALTSLDQVTGRNVVAPIPNGTILRAEQFRAANVIRQGQTVQITAKGTGFTVTSDGQAMGNAAIGQVITVKTRSGQLIKGIARGEGVVEVVF